MTTGLERAANVIDRKGNIAVQGVFHGKEFNHLVGLSIKIEKMPLRELMLSDIYNVFDDMSSSSSGGKSMQEFIHIMFLAFNEAIYSQGREEMKLAGKLTDELFEGTSSVKIYSRPKIKGIRIEIHYPEAETVLIDLTKHYIAIKIKENSDRKFREIDIAEFLEKYSDYDPEDTEYTEQQVAIGRNLEDAIFGQSIS